MAVPEGPTEKRYAANGIATVYTIPFLLLGAADLKVYLNDVEVTSGFTVSGIGAPQSTITFTVAPLGALLLQLDVPFQRLNDYQENGDFLSSTVNRDFDRIWQALKQLLRYSARALSLGFFDVDGNGFYRAKGNGIINLASANKVDNAATNWKDVKDQIALVLSSGQGPINSASNIAYLDPNNDVKTVQYLSSPAGAAAIGFDWAAPGVPNSLALAMRRSRNIRMYGAIVEDLTTNNLAAFQAASASGPGIIDARGVTCLVQGQFIPGPGQIWLLAGSKLYPGTYGGTMCFMYQSHDTGVIGPAVIQGTGKAVGTQKGIEVNSSKRFLVHGITAFDMPGHGFYMSGNVGVQRYEGGRMIDCGGHRCYKGYEDLPGAEYMTITNPHFTQCSEFGMKTTAGNVRIVNPQIVDNDKDGLQSFGGVNHAHGGIAGGNINHNVQYNLYMSDVINGLSITGTNFYANNTTGGGAIFLERTKGVNISDGIIDCRVYVYGAVGQNVLRDMYCPGDYGPMVLSDEADKQPALLWVHDCTGAGIRRNFKNINNPGPIYTSVRRVGALQVLAVNTGTPIMFATVVRDDHLAYDVPSGVFTVPATQQGLYRIKAVLVFTAPGYSATSSYAELRINNVAVVLQAAAGFSSNVMVFNFDYEVELNAANTISFVGFIFATTANFGHATYDSRLTIERIG
ncbi:hypothetical protein [Pseudomonas sp. KBW05]|uniref:hypothetical protein n=1 Tax=Pseudomonas sp. KBW05 TaxID=2153360 RepID=UPI000F598E70|nr:hypothetical protein [Pseudomonas sp. KBW05]RQO57534.1 hypothetical protein DBR46_08855 [Pseudomonas sp. KBW05]